MNLNYTVQMEPGAGCNLKCLFICTFPSLAEAKTFFDNIQEDYNEEGDLFMITLRQENKQADRFELLANPKSIRGDTAFLLQVLRFFAERQSGNPLQVQPLVSEEELQQQIKQWKSVLPTNY